MGKIIIYGYSKLSLEITKILSKKDYDFLVIASDDLSVKNAKADGYEAYKSNLSEDENLINVGITKDVSALFCMSEDVHDNLFVTLSARALDANLKIVSFASSKQDEKKMLLSGANWVINPYEIATRRLFSQMQKPTLFWVLDMLLFSTSDIIFGEIKIESDSSFLDLALKDLESKLGSDILVLGLERGDKFIFDTSRSRYHIKKDDVIVIIGEKKDINRRI